MKPKADVKIQNVVAVASLAQSIDLRAIERAFGDGVQWNPKRFPGLVFRLKRPKTATLIFTSGKMVCTGAKSEKEAKGAIKKVVKTLKENGVVILSRPTIEIRNIVASGHLRGDIDLERAVMELSHVIYEPEQFPGLIHSMEEPRVVVLLFTTGAIVCTGARSERMVYEAFEALGRQLDERGLIRYDRRETESSMSPVDGT